MTPESQDIRVVAGYFSKRRKPSTRKPFLPRIGIRDSKDARHLGQIRKSDHNGSGPKIRNLCRGRTSTQVGERPRLVGTDIGHVGDAAAGLIQWAHER